MDEIVKKIIKNELSILQTELKTKQVITENIRNHLKESEEQITVIKNNIDVLKKELNNAKSK